MGRFSQTESAATRRTADRREHFSRGCRSACRPEFGICSWGPVRMRDAGIARGVLTGDSPDPQRSARGNRRVSTRPQAGKTRTAMTIALLAAPTGRPRGGRAATRGQQHNSQTAQLAGERDGMIVPEHGRRKRSHQRARRRVTGRQRPARPEPNGERSPHQQVRDRRGRSTGGRQGPRYDGARTTSSPMGRNAGRRSPSVRVSATGNVGLLRLRQVVPARVRTLQNGSSPSPDTFEGRNGVRVSREACPSSKRVEDDGKPPAKEVVYHGRENGHEVQSRYRRRLTDQPGGNPPIPALPARTGVPAVAGFRPSAGRGGRGVTPTDHFCCG
jgi:hypothetical protein